MSDTNIDYELLGHAEKVAFCEWIKETHGILIRPWDSEYERMWAAFKLDYIEGALK